MASHASRTKRLVPVFAVLPFFLFFEDAEGLAREIGAICVLRIENIAKLIVLKFIQG